MGRGGGEKGKGSRAGPQSKVGQSIGNQRCALIGLAQTPSNERAGGVLCAHGRSDTRSSLCGAGCSWWFQQRVPIRRNPRVVSPREVPKESAPANLLGSVQMHNHEDFTKTTLGPRMFDDTRRTRSQHVRNRGRIAPQRSPSAHGHRHNPATAPRVHARKHSDNAGLAENGWKHLAPSKKPATAPQLGAPHSLPGAGPSSATEDNLLPNLGGRVALPGSLSLALIGCDVDRGTRDILQSLRGSRPG